VWEDDIRKIAVPGQSQQQQRDSISTTTKKWLGVVLCICLPSAFRKLRIGGSWSRLACAKKVRPCFQNNQNREGWKHGSSSEVPASPVGSSEF
jgi:hypothetical protein